MLTHSIISNNCVSAFLYYDLNEQYAHPFMWSTFTPYNFDKFIDTFHTLNYENIDIVDTLLEKAYHTERWNGTYSIIIDKTICVNYTHHFFNAKYDTPYKDGVNIFYKDMKEYLIQKYKTRLKLWKPMDDEPIFILCKTIFYEKDEFYNIAYKETTNKKIVLLPYSYSINMERVPKNTFIVKLPDSINVEPKYSKYLLDNYKDLLEIR